MHQHKNGHEKQKYFIIITSRPWEKIFNNGLKWIQIKMKVIIIQSL